MNLADINPKHHASILAQLSAGRARPAAVVESNPGHAPLVPEEVQRQPHARILVRVTSVRRRLLDEDNLCEKFHVDLCRYAGVIPDDAPELVKIEVAQRKAQPQEEEHTLIEVL